MGITKRAIIILIAVILLGFGYNVFTSLIESKDTKESVDKVEESDVIKTLATSGEEDIGEDYVSESQEVEEFPLDMTEDYVQNAIHSMSHAKVYAPEKRGHLEPTQQRIERLLAVLKQNQDGLSNSDLYISILTRWQMGDFSQAVSDHNKIWELQEGDVGKATRLLTKEEEEEYRAEYY
ncbi:hypothetical protein QFZ87_003075 [Bacillus sp. SLBN-46]|uniref:DUF6241 domain-containing protein n=1 Tax=Bacillus sp. SLBN-46 TaxID=3042283 RepID=UPI00285FD159|nr:DUF6241 domain-containing protein [Bacillus sp. SLBN-46]MDR6123478.1 hypothetical protein [Bacillus sp. SLBN-46]